MRHRNILAVFSVVTPAWEFYKKWRTGGLTCVPHPILKAVQIASTLNQKNVISIFFSFFLVRLFTRFRVGFFYFCCCCLGALSVSDLGLNNENMVEHWGGTRQKIKLLWCINWRAFILSWAHRLTVEFICLWFVTVPELSLIDFIRQPFFFYLLKSSYFFFFLTCVFVFVLYKCQIVDLSIN